MAEEKKSHAGHRERMRNLLRDSGIENMTSQQMLEMLLYQCLPRVDTNKLAGELLKTFDTFSGVINAPVNELMRIGGIGKSTAEFIHSLPLFFRMYLDDMQNNNVRVFDSESAYKLIKNKFVGRKNEVIILMILNSRGNVVYNNVVMEGAVSMVPLYIKKVIELCLEYNADTVIIAHNHPSGDVAPSRGDIVATKELLMALEGIYVTLYDHLIFTDTDFTSIRNSGLLKDIEISIEQMRQSALRDALKAEEMLFKSTGD